MTQSWPPNPQFKLEISGQTYVNDVAFDIQLSRPENNISFLVLRVDDYKSAKYIDVFDAFDIPVLSLRYGSGSWTKEFSGTVTITAPSFGRQGEILEVGAWGEGNALVNTGCDESYGVESGVHGNSAVDTPKEIIEDIIDNHINKIFGAAAASNYTIGKKVEDVHNGLSVTYLDSPYHNNFVNINRLCDIVNAYAQGLGVPEVGIHWFVDPNANLYVKKIDADHSDGSWDRYWGGTQGTDPGTQSSSTIVVKKDMILYNFKKNIDEYANHIVLSSKWRMPSEDYWTEDNGGAALWGNDGNITVTDSATHIVGSHSVKLDTSGATGLGEAWYPSAQNAGWDFTLCGSENTIPSLNMYLYQNKDLATTALSLFTSAGNYFNLPYNLSSYIAANTEWTFLSLPVGPYHNIQQTQVQKRWDDSAGAPDWSNINWIQFSFPFDTTLELYVDDLHFSGAVVREAKDTSEITDHKTYFKPLRNDTAVNDTLVASDDSGTAARLAYAELLRRSQTPIVGMIRIPMAVDLLPGQTVHIHACQKSDGTYRIDHDMRVKELTHHIGKSAMFGGFETILNLTSDVTNTHAFGAPTLYGLLKQYAGALGHSEARDLKGGALDNLIPRLTKSY